MIEKHYGKFLRNDVDEQLVRVFGAQTETLSETLEAQKEEKQGKLLKRQKRGVGGPTWTRTRDQPVMSRWL